MYENNNLNQSSIVVNPHDLSPDTLQSIYAQLVLEYSLFKQKKEDYLKQIDHSLEKKDRIAFYSLTNKFNDFMNKHADGIYIYDKGVQVQVFFK